MVPIVTQVLGKILGQIRESTFQKITFLLSVPVNLL